MPLVEEGVQVFTPTTRHPRGRWGRRMCMYAALGSKVGFIFGAVGVCALIFSFFCVPECKERTMEQVDRMIIESVPLRRFRDHVIADADHAGLEKDKENLGIEVRRVEIV
ncbi:uncharacterized protein L3040_006003 [Drepanopeziza brunnea f. sp. 'multigermtubi']|uniref:uncharacterized protein n=1 Tax=Drepanopeziza brunnea f. sp. 'multigermtubi' TaxID=698441 RepID=UPI00238E87B7|nr:hypothetical protein L3040_006003 [Drepanopeziza brunnea f. sp. 'multigermtubi']